MLVDMLVHVLDDINYTLLVHSYERLFLYDQISKVSQAKQGMKWGDESFGIVQSAIDLFVFDHVLNKRFRDDSEAIGYVFMLFTHQWIEEYSVLYYQLVSLISFHSLNYCQQFEKILYSLYLPATLYKPFLLSQLRKSMFWIDPRIANRPKWEWKANSTNPKFGRYCSSERNRRSNHSFLLHCSCPCNSLKIFKTPSDLFVSIGTKQNVFLEINYSLFCCCLSCWTCWRTTLSYSSSFTVLLSR